jgi:hypothetical protein
MKKSNETEYINKCSNMLISIQLLLLAVFTSVMLF